MGSVLRPSDTECIIEWFLSLPTYNARFELLPTVACVDPKTAKPLLEKAWSVGDRGMKHSILVAASSMRHPWMFIPLGLRDADGFIRELATAFEQTFRGKPAGRYPYATMEQPRVGRSGKKKNHRRDYRESSSLDPDLLE